MLLWSNVESGASSSKLASTLPTMIEDIHWQCCGTMVYAITSFEVFSTTQYNFCHSIHLGRHKIPLIWMKSTSLLSQNNEKLQIFPNESMIHRQEFQVENRGQATDVWIAATRTLMLMKAEKSVYLSAWVRVWGSLLYHDRCQLIDTSVASMPKGDGFSFFISSFSSAQPQ